MTVTQVAAAPAGGKSPYRNDSLLSLRGLAAFSVVCHHLGVGAFLAALTGIAMAGALAISGSYAVEIFFCISGYLMAKILDRSYGPGHVGKFYWNRAARVLPTYYLAVAVTAALSWHTIGANAWPILLLVDNYFFEPRLANPALWSLSTEFQFYLIAPLVAATIRIWRPALVLLLLTALAVKILYFVGINRLSWEPREFVYMGLEANLIFFMSGWFGYVHRARLPVLPPRTGLMIVTAVVAAVWLFHFTYIDNSFAGLCGSAAWMLVFPVAIGAMCILVLPSLDDGGSAGSLSSVDRVLYFLGVTSYSVYVLHMSYMTTVPALLQLMFVYAAAFGVFVVFERPLFRLRVV